MEEILQNTGGILISLAIFQREYPADFDDSTALGHAAKKRALVSLICSLLSAVVETVYLVSVIRKVLKERRKRREEESSK